MGDTRRFAERTNLITMQPRTDLSSTGYALADPGNEYLILQPSETAEPFSAALAAGRYAIEWYSLTSRETVPAEALTVADDGKISISSTSGTTGPGVVICAGSQAEDGRDHGGAFNTDCHPR